MSEYELGLRGITKVFPTVKALDNVHFKLKVGEIHALMGENGAGKSTLQQSLWLNVYKKNEKGGLDNNYKLRRGCSVVSRLILGTTLG